MGRASNWSYKTGEKGRNRVRAFEDAKAGGIFLEFYERELGSPLARRIRISAQTRDRNSAKQQADKLAAAFGGAKSPAPELTLPLLFDIYLREVTPQKRQSKRKHDYRCAEMFTRFFGLTRKPSTLSRRDVDRFVVERRSGRMRPAGSRGPQPVGNRVIAYDLKWLLSVLNWAALAGDGKGGMLIERNWLRGLSLPREENPRRPVLSQVDYERLLGVADDIDWRCKLALIVAHETGHRISAIRQLRWSDVDFSNRRIRWQAENDKGEREHYTPLTDSALLGFDSVRRSHSSLGEAWVFPSPQDASKPCSRNLVRDWWYRLERRAGVVHRDRLGWHSLRRKFATELKHTSLKDLCALGGWKSAHTILLCYQHEDEATMRSALSGRKPLSIVRYGEKPTV